MTLFPMATALDGDGDGINDVNDKCPFASGTANSTLGLGCPDSDGDGISDFEQAVIHNWDDSGPLLIEKGLMDPNINAVAWAKNSSVFYAASDNDEVRMYDSIGNPLGLIHTMQGGAIDIEVSPDGHSLIVASQNGGCKIINATTGALIHDLYSSIPTNSGVYEAAWSNDGSRVFCGGNERKVHSFYAGNWTYERNYSKWESGWVSGIDTTPDGRLLFFSANQDVFGYWIHNGTPYLEMFNHSGYVRVAVVSPDGRYLATGSQDSSVIVMDIANKSIVAELDFPGQVHDIDFSSDGGSMLVTNGYQDSFLVFRTDTWTEIGELTGFGDADNNRGVWSAEFNEDGDKIAIGWRRGWVSVHTIADNLMVIQGQHYTSLMEDSWRSAYTATDEAVVYSEVDRVLSTLDMCDSEKFIGSSTNGVSPQYATKAANYSTTGLWNCDNTEGKILEIPYGRAAGALMVKADASSQECIESIGGLSMAQVRWMTSASYRNALTSSGEMPGLVWDSVVPNDDSDGVAEWADLDSSCDDDEIILIHREANKTDLTILEEKVLCANCAQTDYMYASGESRLRIDAGAERINVTELVSAPAAGTSIGFTELEFSLDNSNGLYIVPIVDNYTHGAADVIAAGGVAVNATLNASRDGEWPLQTDMRAFISVDHITRNIEFMKFLLSDIAQLKWEQMGFVGLGFWDLYLSWAKLGVDKYYILPDDDSDGVWNRDDLCPNTQLGLSVNSEGCPENELDDDGDGFANDIDDCDDVAGNSTFGSIGCPDQDGDGWQDSDDTHPNDSSEWNDTDMDGFGDNSDDCIDLVGNSTKGSIGCVDSDGDGWADQNDEFPYDNTEWKDSDSDSFGDNIDAFPYVSTQWLDTDNDGFGDNNTGLEGDDCISESGTSNKEGLFGCIDSDGDGWADSIDDLPLNPQQYRDVDGDGVGDSASSGDFDLCQETPSEELAMVDSDGCGPSERDGDYDSFSDDIDQCPSTPLLQTVFVNTTIYLDSQESILNPLLGCAPSEIDLDGDSVTADLDWDDNNANQSVDTDGDGFGDNVEADDGDDCPLQKGTSFRDKRGCLDLDGDGWSYESDFNDGDPTQWSDTDGDGFGDNWDNEDWSEGRTIGQFVIGATEPDRCPSEYSAFLYSDTEGCLTSQNSDDSSDKNSVGEKGDGADSNFALILGIAGTGIILILFGSIAVLLKKQSKPKRKPKEKAVHPALESGLNEDLSEDVVQDIESKKSVEFVSTWEELPDGDWLPNDENGVNWYQDNEGKYWHSTDEGFVVWND